MNPQYAGTEYRVEILEIFAFHFGCYAHGILVRLTAQPLCKKWVPGAEGPPRLHEARNTTWRGALPLNVGTHVLADVTVFSVLMRGAF